MATFYWRAWIGPRFTKPDDTCHFDWSGYTAGSVMARGADTTLAALLADGATSGTLTSATGWAAKGGMWVGPNGSGQGWEYVEYGSLNVNGAFAQAVRELTSVREHNGIHSAGAVARQWWPVEGDDGRLHLSRTMDQDEFQAAAWELEISGVNVPRFALKNTHICVVESRATASAAWTVWAVGWLVSPELADTSDMLGEWRVKVVSVAGMLAQSQVAGLRVGALDASRSGKVIGRKEIPYAFKERHSGDYVGGEPTFEPENVIDGNRDTLWIAEKFHGTRYEADYKAVKTSHFNQSCFPSMLYLHNPPGYAGLRFIEWFIGGSLLDGWLCNKNGATAFASVPSDGSLGDRRVFCEDKSRFLAAHPEIDESAVKEIGSTFFDAIDTASDAVGYYSPLVQYWSNCTAWGSATRPKYYDNEFGWLDGRGWDGPQCAAPGVGQVLRYRYSSSADEPRDHFTVDYVDNVKYEIGQGSNSYVLIRLPGIGLRLRDNISASAPGAGGMLYIEDGGGPGTGGLPASGTVQVGDEQITFSWKGSEGITVSARGAGGTAAAEHLAGDLVYVVDGGVATDGFPLRRVGWRRYRGTIYPKDFKIRLSKHSEVQEPFTGGGTLWENDFETAADVTGHAASTYDSTVFSPAKRARYVMVEIAKMTTDPARPRLNEVVCEVDRSFYDGDYWLDAGIEAWRVLEQILKNGGVPAACIGQTGLTSLPLTSAMTAADSCWKVVSDLAGVCGLRVLVGLDSHIVITAEPVFTGALGSVARTWTRADASRVELELAGESIAGQVALAWMRADGTDEGVVRYPSGGHWRGRPLELGPFYYASSAQAYDAGGVRYHMRRFPYLYIVECADGELGVAPGDYHAVTWQFGADAAWTRQGVVVGVDHVLEEGAWQSVVTLRAVTKEVFDV